MRVASLHRYPVKGLSPEPLLSAMLTAGDYFPGDRLYAVENGPSGFDPDNPVHQPKIKFLMLMRDESLARLKTSYDDASRTLTITREGRVAARGDLSTEGGRESIAGFLGRFIGDRMRGPARTLAAPAGYRFTDSRRGFVSLINLASVAALEPLVNAPVDPLRFRGNIYIEGLEAWRELDLVDATLAIGKTARLKILKRIERCAATNVDPETGARDLSIPRVLMQAFNHTDCGVYADVIAGGEVKPGDSVSLS
ncbi:MAG: MOSC domain-containing protein [Rhizobiales bacterium 65-9]|nr:MOSC domain-containing protein [Hyphomicrobiales bacterium]OJY38698.1 MAG: MOSC domain-containing protein [Rhizobiales bacterium 65-9]